MYKGVREPREKDPNSTWGLLHNPFLKGIMCLGIGAAKMNEPWLLAIRILQSDNETDEQFNLNTMW
jgi:hypothetical protein